MCGLRVSTRPPPYRITVKGIVRPLRQGPRRRSADTTSGESPRLGWAPLALPQASGEAGSSRVPLRPLKVNAPARRDPPVPARPRLADVPAGRLLDPVTPATARPRVARAG